MMQENRFITMLRWSYLLAMLVGCSGCTASLSNESIINTMVVGTMAALPTATATRIPPTPTLLPQPTIIVPTPGSNIPMVTARQRINVRSGPGAAYPSYGVASVGTAAEVVGVSQDGAWWAIKVPAGLIPTGLAWVSGQYVDATHTKDVPVIPSALPPAYVTPIPPQVNGPTVVAVEPLMVRAGPSMDYTSYGIVPAGTSLQAIGVSPDSQWWEVGLPATVAPDGQGWVPINFVQAYRTVNLPVVEPPPPEPIIQPPPPSEDKAPFGVMIEPQNVRAGPGQEYPSYGKVAMGVTAILVGISPDELWYVISIPPNVAANQQGWVKAVNCQAYNAEGLPMIQPPPKP